MVFFNYATMQMAAKIVYYGPGLCGKTTNLHHIYGRTAPDSRGEMVSLETETDRTLFFDLLPLDVGVISGFKTRVQLYTVPGQVFYNTTRKLVLKGVDGIVFVADSQRAMREANLESLANLRANLAEIGLNLDELPLALQFNKRDLANVLALEELERDLNPDRLHETYEASAILGQGVFETLKAISRLTLRSLKKRMLGEDRPTPRGVPAATTPPAPPASRPAETPRAADAPPRATTPPARPSEPPSMRPPPSAARPELRPPTPSRETIALSSAPVRPADRLAAARREEGPTEIEYDAPSASGDPAIHSPQPNSVAPVEEVSEIADVSFAESGESAVPADVGVKHVRVGSNVDILAELERLRKNATSLSPAGRPSRRAASGVSVDDLLANSLNHRKEVSRIFELDVPRRELAAGHEVTVTLAITDAERHRLGEEKKFSIPLETPQDIERLLLSLKFQIFGK